MVHSAVPLVLTLQSWRPERNYKDALSPVAIEDVVDAHFVIPVT